MNYTDKINTFELSDKTKDLLKEQNENINNYNYIKESNYKIGDIVNVTPNTLIHGTRANLEQLEKISKTGLIANEFYSDEIFKKKKPYVVEFWDVVVEMPLADWIKKHTGVTIDFNNREGEVYKKVLCSFEDIRENISKEQGFRDYLIYQNQEQRYLPNDVVDNDASLAFIVEVNENDKDIVKNDIFDIDFDKEILQDMLPEWFYAKYMVTREFDNFETGREKAILIGIPVNMINGIMVSRKIEKDQDSINKIKELFPNCYVCNIDGIVI